MSHNYAQIICTKCGEITHIQAGDLYDEIKPKCRCDKKDYSILDLDSLRLIGKEKKIKSAMQMSREKLLERLSEVNDG